MVNVETKNYKEIEHNFDENNVSLLRLKKYRISDLGKVVTGRTPPSSKPQCFGDKYPFITPSDMDGRKKADVTVRFLSDDGANLLKSSLVPAESVSVSCIGWQMGKSIMTSRPSFTNQQLNTIIPNDKVDADFLYYSLSTRRKELLSLGATTGVRTPILNKSAFSDLEVSLPDIVEQRKIAAILSAYDDLIENNTRRIKIMEEMAQALYREWFVKFRFPGHEKVKMVESVLGMVPEGWEVKPIAELCDFVSRGVTPKYSINSGRYVINQKANRGSYINLDELKELHPDLVVPDAKLAHQKDLLVNCLGEGTIGRVHYFRGPHKKWAVDQHMSICRSGIPSNTNYLYWVLSSREGQAKIESLKTGGTNMTMLNISALRDFTVIYPSKGLISSFDTLTKPIWNMLKALEYKNANLHRTRDLLLPKLISGEVDVSNLTIGTGK